MNNTNPVVIQAAGATGILIVLKALITYIQVMGWFGLTPDQATATIKLFEDILPILVIWIGAAWAFRKVTPLDNPKDKDGVELSRPNDVPPIAVMNKIHEEAIETNETVDERRLVR